jgi:hypothetical protein
MNKRALIISVFSGSLIALLASSLFLLKKECIEKENKLINENKITRIKLKQCQEIENNLEKYEKQLKITTQKLNEVKNLDYDNSKTIINYNDSDFAYFIIRNYKNLSNKSKERIYNSLIKYSKKYNINELLLLSILHTESNLRFWIKHDLVSVNVPLDENWTKVKRIKTNAIGLGGVIWQIWKYDLMKNKIAFVESDLYDIDTNINAVAYIIDKYRTKPVLEKNMSKTESAVLRYYGIVKDKNGKISKQYLQKIKTFIGTILLEKTFNNNEQKL